MDFELWRCSLCDFQAPYELLYLDHFLKTHQQKTNIQKLEDNVQRAVDDAWEKNWET